MNKLVYWVPEIWSAADNAIEPSAAHRKVSEGSFAVCSSMVRAICPSVCSGRWFPGMFLYCIAVCDCEEVEPAFDC